MPDSRGIEILPYQEASAVYRHERVNDLFYAEPWLNVLRKSYGFEFQLALDTASEQFVIFTVLDNLAGKKGRKSTLFRLYGD